VIKLYIESGQRTLPLFSLELPITQHEFISDWNLDSSQNSCHNQWRCLHWTMNLLFTLCLHCSWGCRNRVAMTQSLHSCTQQTHFCHMIIYNAHRCNISCDRISKCKYNALQGCWMLDSDWL